MIKSDYKFETFKAWSELLILLEVQALTNEAFVEIFKAHQERFARQSKLQEFNKQIKAEELDIFIGTDTYLELQYKWQEAIFYSYKFLQYARSRGGTYGHKVGGLWNFLSVNFDQNQLILKILQTP